MSLRGRILVVDDERLFADAAAEALRDEGATVEVAYDLATAKRIAEGFVPSLVLLDNGLPDGFGIEAVGALAGAGASTKVVLVTAYPSIETAVRALREGVDDYLIKPVDLDELVLTATRVLRTAELERIEQAAARRAGTERDRAVPIGSAPAWQRALGWLERARDSDAPVMVTGESGTGKGLFARAIHYGGRRGSETFLPVNCAALPENLVEAELFGAERGAYTGAMSTRRGLFELASGGTLFLDELVEVPLPMQAKLLGALEDKAVRRIGAPRAIPIDTRIVAATNRVPEDEVAAGRFRADLLWRLDVVRIHLPPLRERLTDIGPLVEHFLGLLAPGRGARLAAGELESLADYHWPGNVRELRNVLERSLLVDRGEVLHPSHLLAGPGRIAAAPTPGMAAQPRPTPGGATRTLAEVERDHALAVWEAQGRHAETAATALGISVATLRRRLKEWDVQ